MATPTPEPPGLAEQLMKMDSTCLNKLHANGGVAELRWLYNFSMVNGLYSCPDTPFQK
jgi:hypothetical protein